MGNKCFFVGMDFFSFVKHDRKQSDFFQVLAATALPLVLLPDIKEMHKEVHRGLSKVEESRFLIIMESRFLYNALSFFIIFHSLSS